MTSPPHTPRQGTQAIPPSQRVRALIVFAGVWLIGTGITLLFAHHKHDPFDAFTSRVPLIGVPVVIGVYAAILATVWAALPRPKSEFVREWICNGVTIIGGVFAPHTLSFLFGLLP
jgi:hypothetical protein